MLLHWHVFNMDLVGYHVWRQSETQTVINNFYKEDFNILHPRINDHADTDRIMRMEFPIMQWLFALFYKIFGNDIIITRILSFIIGLCSVWGVYTLCKNVFQNNAIAVIAAWTFNFSPLFYYYTLNPLPDNFALASAIWSVVFAFIYKRKADIIYLLYSALLLSLATLAKLPFILYGIVPFIILWVQRKNSSVLQFFGSLLLYILCIIPAFIWYIKVIPQWGGNVVIKGIFNTKEGLLSLLNILQGNLISTLPELLLNYGSVIFFITGLWLVFKKKRYKQKDFIVFIGWGTAVIAYFLYELNAIGTMHDYYMLPFLPLLFLLVSYGAYHMLLNSRKWVKYLAIFALLILPVTAFLRADSRWNPEDPLFESTYYKYKTQLRTLTPPNALCIIGNDNSHFILLYYIDRKGWAFDNNKLDPAQLEYYISKGAGYLFTDSYIDTIAGIKQHLSQKIFYTGAVRVYKLK